MRISALVSFASFVVAMGMAPLAQAELVYLASGRTLSVKSHRIDGQTMVLELRAGGEIQCDVSVVSRIEPDEVPYPEPAGAARDTGVVAADLALEAPLLPSELLQVDSRYDSLITQASNRHGVDPTLVRAVIQVESNYQPRARSAKGARGLMQLMPSTARQYGVKNPYDPASNIEAGIKHLKSLLDRFPLTLALAAYNAGEATVQRFGGVPPFAETRSYVDRILKLVGRS
jgi:soluble lytic murein transglycosylase-like protein